VKKGKGGETRNERGQNAPLNLRDLHSRIISALTAGISAGAVSISPARVSELRTLHVNDVRGLLLATAHDNVNARTQAKDETGILGVQHQIATRQQHLAWGGNGSRHDVGCSKSLCLVVVVLLWWWWWLTERIIRLSQHKSTTSVVKISLQFPGQ
jgi:hypothetical protein